MELESDVLVSPTGEVPMIEGEVVTAIRALAERKSGAGGASAQQVRTASTRSASDVIRLTTPKALSRANAQR